MITLATGSGTSATSLGNGRHTRARATRLLGALDSYGRGAMAVVMS